MSSGLLLCISGCSLVTYLLDRRSLVHLQLIPNLTSQHEFWRLITSQSIFTSSGEFFLGTIVLYRLRVIERQFGSSKYASFFFVTSTLSTIFEIGALTIGNKYGLTYLPAGPYGFIFSAIYQFYEIIPPIYYYKFLGINFSDKFSLYFCLLPFLAYKFPYSIVAGICGILAGVIYRLDLCNIKKWRLPQFINRFTSRFLSTNTNTSNQSSSIPAVMQRSTTSQSSSAQSLNQEYYDNLQAMFPLSPQESITRALISSDNDINRARKHKAKITFSGDQIPSNESAIVISNHRSYSDFYMLHSVAMRRKMLPHVKYFAKDSLKYIPFFGFGMWLMGMIFIKRNWTEDENHLKKIFKAIKSYAAPIWIVNFVEGTRFRFPVFQNLLFPRTKGFVACVHFTIVYRHITRGLFPPNLFHVHGFPLLSPPWSFHVHVKRYAIEDLPRDEEKLTEWVRQKFIEKDALLEDMKLHWTKSEKLQNVHEEKYF
ncbi:782_t:CDS:10 [Diversispora eburnea]|uniref:782_t:CDS:1 n=1 Tax=Diversispora eburnea TaxID=1213867 RepID=A0A9N9G902_9GLOM|nr:782_t:CDS:10 [Diversispora eburnea]